MNRRCDMRCNGAATGRPSGADGDDGTEILADEVGFDYLWFVERHFLYGFCAASRRRPVHSRVL